MRALWQARWKIGAVFGWDKGSGLGSRVTSLKERLPADVPAAPPDTAFEPFTPLYLLEDEWAAELANHTVHTELGTRRNRWIPRPDGGVGEAKRLVWNRLHDGDQAGSDLLGVSGPAATARTHVARARSRQ